MLDLIISLGWGAFSLTREKAEKLMELVLTRGGINRDESKNTIKVLAARGEKERAEFSYFFQKVTNKLIQKWNYVPREEFNKLQEKVDILAKHVGCEDEKSKEL